ncbi:MAG: YkoP family protein [Tumebacillaceae bacterium]
MNGVWLALWQCGDHIYRKLRRFDYQDLEGRNVFRIRLRTYEGPDVQLPDGSEVKQGDDVGFLHLYNIRLQRLVKDIKSENRRVLVVAREVQRSLPELAEFIRTHPRGQRVKALIGVTLLNRGVEPLGFTVSKLPDTAWFRFKNWYMRLLVVLCHPDGRQRLRRGHSSLMLKRVVMTVEELFRRYGKVQAVSGIDIDKEWELGQTTR